RRWWSARRIRRTAAAPSGATASSPRAWSWSSARPPLRDLAQLLLEGAERVGAGVALGVGEGRVELGLGQIAGRLGRGDHGVGDALRVELVDAEPERIALEDVRRGDVRVVHGDDRPTRGHVLEDLAGGDVPASGGEE